MINKDTNINQIIDQQILLLRLVTASLALLIVIYAVIAVVHVAVIASIFPTGPLGILPTAIIGLAGTWVAQIGYQKIIGISKNLLTDAHSETFSDEFHVDNLFKLTVFFAIFAVLGGIIYFSMQQTFSLDDSILQYQPIQVIYLENATTWDKTRAILFDIWYATPAIMTVSSLYGLVLCAKRFRYDQCPDCGSLLSGHENHCPDCGRSMSQEDEKPDE
ncbi:hypothetical protein [Salinigranum rubrum]|uniref:hypothetical protein n=1 Tax=Salinigranum rubrum TaxID=755307 RepID=UPI0013A55C99|nr:hypothetical protein [Salinigranum rubrum]